MRRIVIALSLLFFGVALVLLLLGLNVVVPIWLVFEGSILLAAILFERWHYRPQVNRRKGRWQRTSERFVDPTTGHSVEVLYNPDTGERDYVDVDTEPGPKVP